MTHHATDPNTIPIVLGGEYLRCCKSTTSPAYGDERGTWPWRYRPLIGHNVTECVRLAVTIVDGRPRCGEHS